MDSDLDHNDRESMNDSNPNMNNIDSDKANSKDTSNDYTNDNSNAKTTPPRHNYHNPHLTPIASIKRPRNNVRLSSANNHNNNNNNNNNNTNINPNKTTPSKPSTYAGRSSSLQNQQCTPVSSIEENCSTNAGIYSTPGAGGVAYPKHQQQQQVEEGLATPISTTNADSFINISKDSSGSIPSTPLMQGSSTSSSNTGSHMQLTSPGATKLQPHLLTRRSSSNTFGTSSFYSTNSGPDSPCLSPMHGVRPLTTRDVHDINNIVVNVPPSLMLQAEDDEDIEQQQQPRHQPRSSSWIGQKVDALFSPVYQLLHHEEQEQKLRERKLEQEDAKKWGVSPSTLGKNTDIDSYGQHGDENNDGDDNDGATPMDVAFSPGDGDDDEEDTINKICISNNDTETQPTSSISSSSIDSNNDVNQGGSAVVNVNNNMAKLLYATRNNADGNLPGGRQGGFHSTTFDDNDDDDDDVVGGDEENHDNGGLTLDKECHTNDAKVISNHHLYLNGDSHSQSGVDMQLNSLGSGDASLSDDDRSMGRPEHPTDMDEFNPWQFIKSLPAYERISDSAKPAVALPPKSPAAPDKTLVLDLDETLVHCTVETPETPADLTFPVVFHGMTYTVHVRLRPWLQQFLERVADKFEIVVFTASQKVYADELLNLIDPQGIYIKHRLFRESCLAVDGNFLKDLNVLGRDLSKTVLVDNSPHAFGYQVDNGIPIESWFDCPDDRELLKLERFLVRTILHVDDVRPAIRRKFQSYKLIEESIPLQLHSPASSTGMYT